MIITKRALPRRTFLRGVGTTLALPLLDAMVPALRATSNGTPRFAVVYIGNGANMSQWTPSTEGVNFEMSPTLKGIEGFRDRLTVFTGLDNFPATDQRGFHRLVGSGCDLGAYERWLDWFVPLVRRN